MSPDDWFWTRVARGDGCWEWRGTRRRDGYGLVTKDGKQQRAHRVSWELANGPIPAGLSVMHRCDNPPCVRPEHLGLGTQRDNMADMDRKARRLSGPLHPWFGQVQAGEANRSAKLTSEQVARIKGMVLAGRYQDEIAEEFGISKANVSLIRCEKAWTDVVPVPYPPFARTRPVGRPPSSGPRGSRCSRR